MAMQKAPPRSVQKRPPAQPKARRGPGPSPGRGAGKAPSLAIPSETWLLWGLLYDLCCAPILILRLLQGRARGADLLRPFLRIALFATAARMTALLIALNFAVFAWEVLCRAGGMGTAAFLHRFALTPADLQAGRLAPLLLHVFAHASLAHLLGNMLMLFVFGREVERRLGPWRTLAAYLGAAMVSTVLSLGAQLALHQQVPTLGASGAVAGMVALGILFSPLTLTFEALVPMPLLVLGWLAIAADLSGVLRQRSDGIDHFAHLGGYLSVLSLYALLQPEERAAARLGLLINLGTALCAALLWLLWLKPLARG
jgi:membrane associated rhomboid family serine protease